MIPHREVCLVKGDHQFRIRFQEGDEMKVVSALADLARDPELEFDWFDAAILSHQLGAESSREPKSAA